MGFQLACVLQGKRVHLHVVLVRSKVNFKNTGKKSDGYINVNNIKYNANWLEIEMGKY